MQDSDKTTTKRDVRDRLRLMAGGKTYPRSDDMNTYVLIPDAIAEIEGLRALVTRLTDVAENLASELRDPGSEAMAAIYCGRHFIYG